MIAIRRGLPPVRISMARISLQRSAFPIPPSHRAAHSFVRRPDKRQRSEEVIERVLGVVDLIETTGCSSEQHDSRLGLQHLAQTPAGIRVGHILEERV